MEKIAFVILALAIFFNAFANIIIKKGMRTARVLDQDIFGALLSIAANPYVIIGIVSFGIAFFLYSGVLSVMDLSMAYPLMTGAGFLLVLFASVFFFGETITSFRFIGIASILFGVILISINR